MRDTRIAERLRSAGLYVVEVDGWKTRGSDSFNPRGSVDHHTAGGRTGNAPSLGVCINGRADLPGPLCNVMVGRDNTCYVVAAGRANHAGKGNWQGLTGNSTVFGVERENVGTPAEPWRDDQTETAERVHAALISALAEPDFNLVCEHKEWAPHRKTDAHTITGDVLRAGVRRLLLPAPPSIHKENDVFYVIGYDGGGALWGYFPQSNKKYAFATHDAYVEATKQPGFGGHLKLIKQQVDAIANIDPSE